MGFVRGVYPFFRFKKQLGESLFVCSIFRFKKQLGERNVEHKPFSQKQKIFFPKYTPQYMTYSSENQRKLNDEARAGPE